MPDAASPQDFAVSILGHEVDELIAAGNACLSAGDAVNAEVLFRSAVVRRPWDPEPHFKLASALLALGRHDDAARAMAEARDQNAGLILEAVAPDAARRDADPALRLKVADALYAQNQMTAAAALYARLIESHPDVPQLRVSLGLSLQHQGRIEESVAAFEGLQRRWSSPQHHSFLHYARAFERATPDALYAEGLRYAQLHAAGLPKGRRSLARKDGKLRIGYFSPLFNQHQLTKFLRPVMEHHDRSRFSIACYAGSPATDDTGQAIKARADVWRDVSGMEDETFALRVAIDQVDILIDLWGHTAGNRLPVFARKPAPICVSWLNYVETTGLAEFDYVLHAAGHDLPGAQALYSETILPIGPVLAPFRQAFDMPPVGETPMLRNGYMTFGCFGHPAKLNRAVFQAWSQILKATPGSRLVLRSGYFDDPALQRATLAYFEAFGVDGGRIAFPAFATGADFLATYREVDLIFDPFPYQGLTTTLDAVSAGVPVLSWEGRQMHDRIGATTLRACGLDALVAPTLDAYVQTAVDLAGDPGGLNALRARVRPGFEASPYRDEAGFTRRLEAVFEEMARVHEARGCAAGTGGLGAAVSSR